MNEQNRQVTESSSGYVDADELLKTLFPNEGSRPTVRWLRAMQRKKLLPYRKINRRVWFSVEECRVAIDRSFTVKALG